MDIRWCGDIFKFDLDRAKGIVASQSERTERDSMTTVSLQAKQDFLEKEASTRDPVKAISEFVWNALDADARTVRVELIKNALGGIRALEIIDDGHGITKARAERDFGNLGDSLKKDTARTPKFKRVIHGKEGRGRLKFFSLAKRAEWLTTAQSDAGEVEKISIQIDAKTLDHCEVSDPETVEGVTGTVVHLEPLKDLFGELDTTEAFRYFSTIFAPYILQYPDVSIHYNGFKLDPRITINRQHEIPQRSIKTPNREIGDLKLRVIEWNDNIESRQIFFGSESGVVLDSQPAHVTAPNFAYSAYAYSAFFQELHDANLLQMDGLNDPDFQCLLDHIRSDLTDYFRARQAEIAGGLIAELKSEGAYPYEGEPADEVERRERQVFDIATHAVSSYSREFSKADTSLKKMNLALLKEVVKHNPDALSNILHEVARLPKNKQDEFSDLLKRTKLSNIITSSQLIADRVAALRILDGMVFNPKYRNTVKERGQLDRLISSNTWMFGEQFHIALPEIGLTKVMQRIAEDQGSRRRKGKSVRTPDGKIARVDQFLGRRIPQANQSLREYLIVELKKPSIKVGRKELDQVEDYMRTLVTQPDYNHTATRWSFFLVTTEYDEVVAERAGQADRELGLIQEKDNYQIWVKTWGEIIRECEARLHFIQEKLEVEVTDEEIDAHIQALSGSILKGSE